MLPSSYPIAGDVFEVVSFKFIEGIDIEVQTKYMTQLNDFVSSFEGFKSRDFFYSSEIGRWIDLVVWSDLKFATKASDALMKDPVAGAIFSKIEKKSMVFSHYMRMGGVRKN
jgi:hypothetical protein